MAAQVMLDELRTRSSSKEEAWEALYRQHFGEVYRFVWRAGAPADEVEDLTQRAFVVAYERIDDLHQLTNARAWLRGIALRLLAAHRRWRKVRELKRWLVKAEPPPPITPEQHVATDQLGELVRRALEGISPKLRDALVLCDMEDLTPAEAAEILGVPLNTVRSRRRLAREEFARAWASLGEAV
jgi:RNA polymerase sigma-70 factor, ECF subfamily